MNKKYSKPIITVIEVNMTELLCQSPNYTMRFSSDEYASHSEDDEEEEVL